MKKVLLLDYARSNCPPQRMIASLSFVLFILTFITNADGQQIINAGPDQNLTNCGGTTTLTATIAPTQSTTSYTVSTIPYSADPYNQGTLVTLGDDQIASQSVLLPFNFCFYGNSYNRVYICSNNWIGFSAGQTPTWVTTSIPNSGGTAPRNCIMGPWQDIQPSAGGSIRWAVYGTAPYRRFVVSYFNVPMYLCTGLLYSSQIKIYETTNVIETHILNKPLCTNWNSGRAVHGLHNASGTAATIVAGRNNTQWTTNNEGTRFTPSGGAAAYNVEWLDANNNVISTTATATVNPQSGSQTYTARISYLCPANQYTDQVVVNVPQPPTSTFTMPAATCVGQAATITYNGTATANATYTWNFNGGTVVSGSGQGPYQVVWNTAGPKTVTLDVTQNGCPSGQSTQNITVNALPVAAITAPATVCNPDTVAVSFGGSQLQGATYNWNFGGGNVVSGTNAGPYNVSWATAGAKNLTLTVTQNGCQSAPANTTVNVFTTPSADFQSPAAICQNTAMPVNYTGTGSTSATYTWNFGGATVNSGSGQGPYQIQYANTGAQTISLTVTENGCTSPVYNANVNVNLVPTSSFVPTTPICLNAASTILYTGNAGANATFNWNFDNGNVISGANNGPYQVMWATAGVKNVSLTVSQNGCTSTPTTLTVSVDSMPVADAGADVTLCSGQQIQIGTPGINGAIYNWSPMAGLVANNVAQPTVDLINNTTSPVTSAYVVSVSYGNQCVNSDTVNVTVKPTPVVDFTVPQGQCLDVNNFTINANGSFSNNAQFAWTVDGAATSYYGAQCNATFATTGVHPITVTVTDFGCTSNTYSGNVEVYEMPVANFTGTNLYGCMPLTANFEDMSTSADPIAAYKWDFQIGSANGANPSFTFTQEGTFDVTLTITTINGCTATFTQSNYVWAKAMPVANFEVSTTEVDAVYDPYVSITNLSNAQYYFYSWGDGQTTTSPYGDHAYTTPGTYTITQVVKNEFGCVDTAYRTITSKPSQTIYVPTAFTPNNDYLNEEFKAQGLLVSNFKMQIFNRWGQLLFSSNDIDNGWDGTFQGAECQPGVYTYKITYDMNDVSGKGRQEVIDGMVTLIR